MSRFALILAVGLVLLDDEAFAKATGRQKGRGGGGSQSVGSEEELDSSELWVECERELGSSVLFPDFQHLDRSTIIEQSIAVYTKAEVTRFMKELSLYGFSVGDLLNTLGLFAGVLENHSIDKEDKVDYTVMTMLHCMTDDDFMLFVHWLAEGECKEDVSVFLGDLSDGKKAGDCVEKEEEEEVKVTEKKAVAEDDLLEVLEGLKDALERREAAVNKIKPVSTKRSPKLNLEALHKALQRAKRDN